MVLPIAIAVGGAIVGVLSGWALDKAIGDGHYTAGEAAADATFGAVGMGLLKGATKIGGGIRYAASARKARSADDVATIMTTGFAASTQGSAEIAAVVIGSHAIESALSPSVAVGTAHGPSVPVTIETFGPMSSKTGGKKGRSGKTWCRRHRQYDNCR